MTERRAGPGGRPPGGDPDGALDEALDEAEDQSFPASDPQSSWAGPDRQVAGRAVQGRRRG